jgi:hypothetical protein
VGEWALYLEDVLLGHVAAKGEDFPRLHGVFTPEAFLRTPSTAKEDRIAEFYQLNCESHRLVDLEDSTDVATELARNDAALEPYQDLIDSPHWTLQNRNDVLPILCPAFRSGGAITWSWRPS